MDFKWSANSLKMSSNTLLIVFEKSSNSLQMDFMMMKMMAQVSSRIDKDVESAEEGAEQRSHLLKVHFLEELPVLNIAGKLWISPDLT